MAEKPEKPKTKVAGNFRSSSKNEGHQKPKVVPQDWSGVLKVFPEGQGVWNTPCKKNPTGQILTAP